jgi:hypothetical protein
MKTFFLVLLTFATISAQAGTIQTLDVFNKQIVLPVSARFVQVDSAKVENTIIAYDVAPIPGCTLSYDGPADECISRKPIREKTLQVTLKYDQSSTSAIDETSVGYIYIQTNLKLSEMNQAKLDAIPKINLFGRGRKANQQFVMANLVNVTVQPVVISKTVVDSEKSKYCETDGNGEKVDLSCKDVIVLKTVYTTQELVELSAK